MPDGRGAPDQAGAAEAARARVRTSAAETAGPRVWASARERRGRGCRTEAAPRIRRVRQRRRGPGSDERTRAARARMPNGSRAPDQPVAEPSVLAQPGCGAAMGSSFGGGEPVSNRTVAAAGPRHPGPLLLFWPRRSRAEVLGPIQFNDVDAKPRSARSAQPLLHSFKDTRRIVEHFSESHSLILPQPSAWFDVHSIRQPPSSG